MDSIRPEDFMKEVLKTVEVIGVEKTVVALQNTRAQHGIQLSDPTIQFVFKEVGRLLDISIEEILEGRYSKNECRYYAIGFSAFALSGEFGFSMKQLSKLFGFN